MRIVAGVDCHKSSHTIVFLNAVGQTVETLTIATSDEGYCEALTRAALLGCTEWGVEGTGCYGFAFAVYAATTGATVWEVPGVYTKRHRRQGSHHGKSDINDARAVAEVVLREAGRLAQFQLAVTQRALRLRYDQRDRYVRERTAAANRLRGAAVLIGIVKLPADLTSNRTARHLAAQVTAFRTETVVNVATVAVLDEIYDAAATIERLNTKIKDLERTIRDLVRPIAPELLALHGVSTIVAAGLVGHAGDMRNYRDAAAFAAKCGAAPLACSSGRTAAVRVNIGGDRQLNRLLHIIAMSQVLRRGHVGRAYYDRKRAEGKTHLAAMRCLKRRLATIVFYRLQRVDQQLTAMDTTGPLARAA